MRNYFSFKSLKARTVQNKFNIIISLIILILLFGLVNFWLSMNIMSGIRSYVGGEGLWSKAQKEAVNNLIRYSYSGNEADYRNYLRYIQVQLGDKQARLELNKSHPDLTIVRQGFIQGGNNPNDVDDLIFLYRRFRHVSYMSSAIQTWTQGDQEIANLRSIGEQIHSLVPSSANRAQTQAAKLTKLEVLRTQTYRSDAKLTVLENRFSATLGNGSRGIAHILLEITVTTTLLLGALTLVVATLIARAIIHLDKLKTEFVSLASHQLRTPLTAINWYAESLLSESKGSLNKEQAKDLKELANGGHRMANLISDLLQVSNLDLGTYPSKIKPVDLGETMRTVIKDQQVDIDQKNISLTVDIDPNLPKINLDEQLIAVVFQNLLSNSIKYAKSGGMIELSLQAKKSNVLIRVSDDGMGIPQAQQPLIFSKLFRADNAKKLNSNGTGLGLYIVKAMVQLMGGTIRFDSIENKGTTFYVKLPLYGGSYSGRNRQKNG